MKTLAPLIALLALNCLSACGPNDVAPGATSHADDYLLPLGSPCLTDQSCNLSGVAGTEEVCSANTYTCVTGCHQASDCPITQYGPNGPGFVCADGQCVSDPNVFEPDPACEYNSDCIAMEGAGNLSVLHPVVCVQSNNPYGSGSLSFCVTGNPEGSSISPPQRPGTGNPSGSLCLYDVQCASSLCVGSDQTDAIVSDWQSCIASQCTCQ